METKNRLTPLKWHAPLSREEQEGYEVPVIKTIEVRVEQGFSITTITPGGDPNDDDDTW